MNDHFRKKVLEHLIGPTGSIILHIVIIIALIHFVTFESRELTSEIEVAMMEIETVDIDDLFEELDQDIEPLDFEIDIDMPQVDVEVDVPPDPTEFTQPEPDVEFAALDVVNMESPLTMRDLYSGRTAAGRAQRLREYGGRHGAATEAAVLRALNWLRDNQLENGSWAHGGAPSAMTGLGIMTFLAHGETVDSKDYGRTVRRAIQFLVSQQQPNGNFRNTGKHHVYGHAIGAYAISEAFAMTRIPELRGVMDRSIQVIVDGQQAGGGWDYGWGKGARRDTSVVGWQVQALKAAQMAGSNVEGLQSAMDRALDDLRTAHNSETGSFGYTLPIQGGHRIYSMTSIALLSYQLTGNASRPEARRGLEFMAGAPFSWDNPEPWPMYRWYYYTQVKFQQGGAAWQNWNNRFAPAYVANQNSDGSWTSPAAARSGGGTERPQGPVYTTTLAALALQVYYRLLPTFRVVEEAPTESPDSTSDDIIIEII